MANIFQYTVDNTSPTVSYFPFGDTFATPELLLGWNPFYTNTGFATAPGAIGNGTSYHATSVNGASLSLQWNGTGISLFGNATNAVYDVMLDGVLAPPNSSAPAGNLLAAFHDLPNAAHTISLTVRILTAPSPDTIIAFDKALVEYPSPAGNVSIISHSLSSTDIAFFGAWASRSDAEPSGSSYHISSTPGDRASLQFRGTGITVNGLRSPDCGRYRVVLNGQVSSFSARSSFTEPDSLLFFAIGLDAEATHQLTIFNDEGMALALRSEGVRVATLQGVTPVAPSDIPPASSSAPASPSRISSCPKSTIAALSLAAILALLLITSVLFYFFFWRPRNRRRRQERREMLRQRRRMEGLSKDNDKRFGGDVLVIEPSVEPLDLEDLDDGRELGAHDYMPSPVDSKDGKVDDAKSQLSYTATRPTGKKGKGRARDRTWSNITLDFPLPNLSRPSSRRKRASASSGSEPLSQKSDDVPLPAPEQDMTLSKAIPAGPDPLPSDHSLDPSDSPDQSNGAKAADNDADYGPIPLGDTAALALSPRTSDLGSKRPSLRSLRDTVSALLGIEEGKPLLNLSESSPFRVDFAGDGSGRSPEESRKNSKARVKGKSKGKDTAKSKGSRVGPESSHSLPRRREELLSVQVAPGRQQEMADVSGGSQRQVTSSHLFQPPMQEGANNERHSFLDLGCSNPSTQGGDSDRPPDQEASSSEQKRSTWGDSARSIHKKLSARALRPLVSRWSTTTGPSVQHDPPSPQSESRVSAYRIHPYASSPPSRLQMVPVWPRITDTSPTESVPLTVSDINFRHSISSRASNFPQSARNSRTITASPLPPHPPLSSFVKAQQHRRSQTLPQLTVGTSGRASPPLIVQKVLGMSNTPATSPTTNPSSSSSGSLTPRQNARSPTLPTFLPSGLRFSSSLHRSKAPSKTSSD